MSVSLMAGLLLVVLTVVLMGLFAYIDRHQKRGNLRPIPSLESLQKSISLVVEGGKGMHVSLGRGGVLGPQFGGSIMALNILKHAARQSVNGDIPPLSTSGDGLLNILGQETLEAAYSGSRLPQGYGIMGSQVTGVTPYSYVAGAMMAQHPDNQAVVVITGNYGAEVALLADMAERSRMHTISGTNDLTAQAMLFVTTRAPLIGEEFFAANAYIQPSGLNLASVRTQDILRVMLAVGMIVGVILKLAGAV
jgi:hypothetical protein